MRLDSGIDGIEALSVEVEVQRHTVTFDDDISDTRLEQAKVDELKIGAEVAESNVNTMFWPSLENEAEVTLG